MVDITTDEMNAAEPNAINTTTPAPEADTESTIPADHSAATVFVGLRLSTLSIILCGIVVFLVLVCLVIVIWIAKKERIRQLYADLKQKVLGLCRPNDHIPVIRQPVSEHSDDKPDYHLVPNETKEDPTESAHNSAHPPLSPKSGTELKTNATARPTNPERDPEAAPFPVQPMESSV